MESQVCKKYENCPIFQKDVLFSERTGETYKKLYCLSEKFPSCKRYLVSEVIKRPVPEKIMPNSILTVEEIIDKIESGFYQ